MALTKEAILEHLGIAAALHGVQNGITNHMLKSRATYDGLVESFVRGSKGVGEKVHASQAVTGIVSPEVHILHRAAYDAGAKASSRADKLVAARLASGQVDKLSKLTNHPKVKASLDKLQEKTGLPVHDIVKDKDFVKNYVSKSTNPVVKNTREAVESLKDKSRVDKLDLKPNTSGVTPHHIMGAANAAFAVAKDPVAGAVSGAKVLASSRLSEKSKGLQIFQKKMHEHFVENAFQKGVSDGLSGTHSKVRSALRRFGLNSGSEHVRDAGRDIAEAWRKHVQGS